MIEPILIYKRGAGWVYEPSADFTTHLRNGKIVDCYYRKPVHGDWYTNFGTRALGYVDDDGKVNERGMTHINTCNYGYRFDLSIEKDFGWHSDTFYEENAIYVVIVPRDR